MKNFDTIGLIAPILKALAGESYTTPTPIQAQAIPEILKGRDLLGLAQTGTGKTAAFALPILNHLSVKPRRAGPKACRALILSPTRELASQIEASFRTYGRHLPLTAAVIFGGIPIGRQIRQMQNGVDIVVATPGRLLDLVNQRAVSLSEVEIFVLDEADQMLDMGFIHDIRKLLTHLPKQRQNLFFSATMPREMADLSSQLLKDPARVTVTPVSSTVERIDQSVIFCEQGHKQTLLHNLLGAIDMPRTLVFSRTKHGADRIVRNLNAAGHAADAIHGNKSQNQRERALLAFRNGQSRLLVATDIAARGIDIDGVTHVVNFDLPNVPESYVHRIGRTARAGADGQAISFCSRDERPYLRDIERLTRQSVPVVENPLGPSAAASAPAEASPKPAHKPGRPNGHAKRPDQRQRQQQPRDQKSSRDHTQKTKASGHRHSSR